MTDVDEPFAKRPRGREPERLGDILPRVFAAIVRHAVGEEQPSDHGSHTRPRGAAEAARMMLEAAISYGRRGWRVFPVAGKVPRLAAWPTQATTDEATQRRWWRTWPTADVGIATGDGLVVLDVDPRHGGDSSLADLERQHGPLPDTPRVLTGGGGLHLYFAVDQTIGNRAGLAPGIDLRGDGGFVVAPPSVHANGRRYAWELGASPADVPLAPAPEWLLERIRDNDRPAGTPRPPDEWATLVCGPIPAGARNDSLARLAGYLLRRRPAPRVVLELVRAVNQARCVPPLPDDEIVRTVDSIARRELARRQEALC